MKFKTAFHLLVVSMIAIGVTSCGSDKNTADSGSVATTPVVTTSTNLLSIMQANPGNGVSSREELLAAISNHQFDKASTAGIYSFVKNNSTSSNSNCKKVLGFLNMCYSTSSSSNSSMMINNYYHRKLNSDGTIEKDFSNSDGWGNTSGYVYEAAESDYQFGNDIGALKDWLYSLVANADSIVYDNTSYSTNGYKGFKIKSGDWYYYIDLRLQLIMNPYKVHQ